MAQAGVTYIVNGYIVSGLTGLGTPGPNAETHFAGTLDDVMYWVKYFHGVSVGAAPTPPAYVQPVYPPSYDPVANQQAIVETIVEGFLVRMAPNQASAYAERRRVSYEARCPTYRDVQGLLNLIFSVPDAPLPPTPPADRQPPTGW